MIIFLEYNGGVYIYNGGVYRQISIHSYLDLWVVLLLVTQSDGIFNIGNTIYYYTMGLFNQASNHQHHLNSMRLSLLDPTTFVFLLFLHDSLPLPKPLSIR